MFAEYTCHFDLFSHSFSVVIKKKKLFDEFYLLTCACPISSLLNSRVVMNGSKCELKIIEFSCIDIEFGFGVTTSIDPKNILSQAFYYKSTNDGATITQSQVSCYKYSFP